ncbi:phosphatase PAP2 family protein [Formosa algae]|uniref:phosphatase PAP2 family protein n=1 Tax=Formosa algae TaxID=225843 RepID=UPI000CD1DAC3
MHSCPKKDYINFFWTTILILIGISIAFSRVAVGAHYPIDVIIGSTIGYMLAILSIRLNANIDWLNWMKNRKYYPIFMLIFIIWAYLITLKILKYNLVIFYLSILVLLITFLLIVIEYVTKNKA